MVKPKSGHARQRSNGRAWGSYRDMKCRCAACLCNLGEHCCIQCRREKVRERRGFPTPRRCNGKMFMFGDDMLMLRRRLPLAPMSSALGD